MSAKILGICKKSFAGQWHVRLHTNLPETFSRNHSAFNWPCMRIGSIRFLSDDSGTGNAQTRRKTNDTGQELVSTGPQDRDIPEQELSVSAFGRTQLVPEGPITGLNLEQRIKKVPKKGSFSVDNFAGKYDEDFLTYPDPLESRNDNLRLKDQVTMVKQLWPQIWDDQSQLLKFNFFNLFQLSAAEMMTVFEAIGASTRACYEDNPNLEPSSAPHNVMVARTIVSLIIRNCLTYWPIHRSDCDNMKQILLPKRHVLFEDTHSDMTSIPNIGFCWTESTPVLGSLAPQEWLTLGQHGGPHADSYEIKGVKTRVFHDESTEYCLVFFRDKFLAENYKDEWPEEDANPASDPFMGSCVIHNTELTHRPIYQDSAGFKYTDVEINTIVPGDRAIIKPKRCDASGLNVKALGQVATCSVVMGLLKDSLRRTYAHLISNRQGVLDCEIVKRKLASVTAKIFAIESMVYYIAGMFDGLDDGFDAHLEATILKIVTNDYALEALRDLQQICGSGMFITSQVSDLINIFDSFLDGNVHNRLYLAMMGIIWYARSKNTNLNQLRLAPWYPGYLIRHMFRERAEMNNYLTLDADIYGNLHPSLKNAAVNLEFITKRIKFGAEHLCMVYGKDATGAQSQLARLSQLSIDSFVLTTSCARASKSYCNGSRNSDIDVALATSLSEDLVRQTKIYMEEIKLNPANLIDNRSPLVNQMNLKYGGYYAESPLDPNC